MMFLRHRDPAPQPGPEPMAVSLVGLLWVYAVIPVSVAVMLADRVLWAGALGNQLPRTPNNLLVLALLFGTPHIVASNLILVTNRDYFRHYRSRFVGISLGLAAFFAVFGSTLPRPIIVALISAWTVAHVVKQQVGLGNSTARHSGPMFWTWSWVGIGAGMLYYNAIFQARVFTDGQLRLLAAVVAALAIIVAGLTIALAARTGNPLGRRWVVANGALMSLAAMAYLLGYPFFAILMPRVVHDVTAFVVYISHDANRALAGVANRFYRPHRRPTGLALLALPAIAVAVSATLEHGADRVVNRALGALGGIQIHEPVSLGVVGFLALQHYAFESFTWKSSSPYRRYLHLRFS